MTSTSIATARLNLQPFPLNSDTFRVALHELLSDADVMRYMERERHADSWATSLYIGRAYELEQYNRGRALAIWERAGRFVGVLSMASDKPHEIVFGGYLSPSAQRKGYALEVTAAIAEWAFANAHVRRLAAQCDVRNAGAAKVLERAGFQLEGRLARAWPGFGGEEPRDVFSYSITR